MNDCYIWGKIVSDIDFKFFYNSKKHVSVVEFSVRPFMNQIYEYETEELLLVGYDKIADSIYQNFELGSSICVRCKIIDNKVEVVYVY